MSTLMSQAAAAMSRAIRQVAGRTVTIRRGSDSIDVTAVPSEARVTVADATSRVAVEIPVRDYLIAADQFTGLSPAEPVEGDLLEETDLLGTTRTYQVLSPGGDEPAWRWSDPDRQTARLHAKLIAEAAGT